MKKFYTAALMVLLSAPTFAKTNMESYIYGSASGLFGMQRFSKFRIDTYDLTTLGWTRQPHPKAMDDNTWGGSLALGYGRGDIRTEVELTIREKAVIRDFHVKSDSLMLNIYYDWNNSSRFIPFIGGGIGATNIALHVRGMDLSDTRTNLTGMFTAGLGFRITDGLSLNLSYRYFALGFIGLRREIDSSNINSEILSVEARNISNEFLAGVRYKF